jgi:hypothetical protein
LVPEAAYDEPPGAKSRRFLPEIAVWNKNNLNPGGNEVKGLGRCLRWPHGNLPL